MILDSLMNGLTCFNRLDFTCALVVAYLLFRAVFTKGRQRNLPLPPGPKPFPFLGNLFDIPEGTEGPNYTKYAQRYGPIYSFKILGQTFIVVNDKQYAFDLLEKRSSIYSSRPPFTFGGEMVGFNRWLMGVMPYDDTFKMHRKLMRKTIGSRSALLKCESSKEIEARRFLLRILETPDKMMDHLRTLQGSILLKMTHGYTVTADSKCIDPLVALGDEAMGVPFQKGCAYGTWAVDLFPPLKYLPDWLPGMGFKRQARQWAKVVNAVREVPVAFVKYQMVAGKAVSSFVSEALGECGSDEAHLIKCVATTMFAGGLDTTMAGLGTAFLAMTLNPVVFKRAREEIDRVVGIERLPSYSDRPNLPYINALLKETLRWETIVDVNLPHMSTEEDVYMGYRIPKGSLILANIWQMAHDSGNYPDPFAFNPGRFLEESGHAIEQDPKTLVFGFGRRICPGKEFADSTLFITIAMMVAVFNISKAKDALGNDIEPLREYVPGTIRYPKPFKCSILPRSDKAIALIHSVSEEPLHKGDAEILKDLGLAMR